MFAHFSLALINLRLNLKGKLEKQNVYSGKHEACNTIEQCYAEGYQFAI